MKIYTCIAQLALIGSVFAVLSWSQPVSTAQISGTVQDSTGSAVPGAEVRATQVDTGVVRSAVSGADGLYVLPSLPVGPYTLDVTKDGFSKFTQTGIVLQVASNPTIPVTLQVGAVSQQVEVQANAAMVETQSTGVGTVIESKRIVDLPLIGRQVTDLITLSGAATTGSDLDTLSPRNYPSEVEFSVAGGEATGVTYMLDGAMHNDPYTNLGLPLPFPDALQEFKVETSSLPAQYGIHPSAAVNAVTKSGTNEWHGSAFEFIRNYALDARMFFAPTRDSLKRNQFGGTFGGPIMKNKLFFFVAYQQTETRQSPTGTQAFVPTAAMLNGDFSYVASAACQGHQVQLKNPTTGQAFPGNQIPVSLISPVALKIASELPAASTGCGLTNWGVPTNENETFGVAKADYQLSSTHSIFVRYEAPHDSLAVPYTLTNNLLTTGTPGDNDLVQSLTVGDTYLLSASTVNSFRATFDRTAIARVQSNFFDGPGIGINMYSSDPTYLSLSVTGGFSFGGTYSAATFRTTTLQFGDDVAIVKGNHQIAFGANIAGWDSSELANAFGPGSFSFNGQESGLGLADFLLGSFSSFSQGGPTVLPVRQKYIGLYAQDNWKVTPRLSINYGVRWEPFLPASYGFGTVEHFDLNAFEAGTKTTQYTNAPAGISYPGDPGFPGSRGTNRDWKQFGPRVGIVWDPFGDGKTSIRASYGIFYDIIPVQAVLTTPQGPPFGFRVSLTGGQLQNPWATYAGGDPFPVTRSANVPFPTYGSFSTYPYNLSPPNSQQRNFSIQRQVAKDWMVSASYLGNEITHISGAREENLPQFLGLGACVLNGVSYPVCSTTANENQRRLTSILNPAQGKYYGFIAGYDDGGTGNYNGLLLSVQKRYGHGVLLNANYTWSHCISDLSVSGFQEGGGSGGDGYVSPTNRGYDRGNCNTSATDQRNIFNATAVFDSPKLSGNAFVGDLTKDWRLSAAVTAASGTWFTVTGLDQALTGVSNQHAEQVLMNVYAPAGSKSPLATPAVAWLNTAAYAEPALGTYGDSGQASVEGPGELIVNLGLTRLFRIKERNTVEIRAEAQNALNRANFLNPTGAINSNTFGQITTTGPARIMQFAVKYAF